MNKFFKQSLIIIIIIWLCFLLIWSLLSINPKYLGSSDKKRLEFELSKDNFEKHRKEYEEIKDCFIKEKIWNFELCKSLDYKKYLDNLNLSRVSSYSFSEYWEKNIVDIYFAKINPKWRNKNDYIYTNNFNDFHKKIIKDSNVNIDDKWNKYYYIKEGTEKYKYTIIDDNWLIYELVKK